MLKFYFCVFTMLLALTLGAYAQGVTTAAISGRVTDSEGKSLAGATITVIHLPTGTKAGTISNKNGRFSLQGLRVGGPFSVTATMIGFAKDEKTGVFLALDQNLSIEFVMSEKGITTGEIYCFCRQK